MALRSDEAKDIARAFCRPRIGSKRPQSIAIDLDWSKHSDRQVGYRRLLDDGRSHRQWQQWDRRLFSQIMRQQLSGFCLSKQGLIPLDLYLKPMFVIISGSQL